MNQERIKELKREAEALAYEEHKANCIKNGRDPSMPHANALNMTFEKFAELIIKEYEKLLPEICPWDQADKEGPMKGWHVQFVARKHFGVEE
jgi:hypothetical protein